ncbi:class II aldolase/adducin family protein [Ammoniphilus sp. YIM 78166]|uniref:class II aldolase/adducin family protein n=1 Tax=Ammoniphilus sp. YIM 78166 TaxID=1644106 RepID=UPI00106FEB8C|nr:class II aldolase/adducin family protein [Ammoniphilus sp. YIM 78166]
MNSASTLLDAKTKVSTACRLINESGLGDYSGHVSMKVPELDGFYINGRTTSRAALTPNDILLCTMEGAKLQGSDIPPSEIAIHTQIYKHRPDVGCVAHFHPPNAVLFSVLDRPLIPVFLKGAMVGPVPVHDNPRHINTIEKGDALATSLGDGKAILLRGHGVVVVGKTVEEVFFLSICLEENARRYYQALAIGEPKPLSSNEQLDLIGSGYRQEKFKKIWDYYYSKYSSEI